MDDTTEEMLQLFGVPPGEAETHAAGWQLLLLPPELILQLVVAVDISWQFHNSWQLTSAHKVADSQTVEPLGEKRTGEELCVASPYVRGWRGVRIWAPSWQMLHSRYVSLTFEIQVNLVYGWIYEKCRRVVLVMYCRDKNIYHAGGLC